MMHYVLRSSFGIRTILLFGLMFMGSSIVDAAFKDSIPTLDQVRAEVEANPHGLAPSLLRFVEFVFGEEQKAMQSQEAARALFTDLRSCVLNSQVITASLARAMCLSAATHLGNKFGGIKPAADRLLSQTPEEVRKLFRELR